MSTLGSEFDNSNGPCPSFGAFEKRANTRQRFSTLPQVWPLLSSHRSACASAARQGGGAIRRVTSAESGFQLLFFNIIICLFGFKANLSPLDKYVFISCRGLEQANGRWTLPTQSSKFLRVLRLGRLQVVDRLQRAQKESEASLQERAGSHALSQLPSGLLPVYLFLGRDPLKLNQPKKDAPFFPWKSTGHLSCVSLRFVGALKDPAA